MARRISWLMLAVVAWCTSTLEAQGTTEMDAVVTWLQPLILEESDDALNATPRLALDPEGGFIVTDRQEGQVRVYGSDGSLRLFFGRSGDGPGEFQGVQAATRLPSGGFAVVDYEGRLSLWTEMGELRRDHRLDFGGLIAVSASSEGFVTIGTEPSPSSFEDLHAPIFHEVSVESGEVVGEYFTFPLTLDNAMAALTVQGSLAPSLSLTRGVTWTVFDSLWVVDASTRAVSRRLKLESEALEANQPPVDRRRDPEGYGEWMRTTSFPVEAFPTPDGGWLVTLSSFGQDGIEWALLRVDAEGRKVWEVPRAPRLVAVDLEAGVLYFVRVDTLEPNRFERARLLVSGSS